MRNCIAIASAVALSSAMPVAQDGLVASPGNLLVNGSGESGEAPRGGEAPIPGWETLAGAFRVQRGPWSKLDAFEGGAFLRPSAGEFAELAQTVALGTPRPTTLLLRAWTCTLRSKDRAALRLEVLDATGQVLAEAASVERGSPDWRLVELPLTVPAAATAARVTLRGVRHDGEFADACFDAVALEDFGTGLPQGFAGLPRERLLALLDEPGRDARRAAQRALAVDARSASVLLERWRKATDPASRRELGSALILGGRELGAEPFTALLASAERADREAALELLAGVGFDATRSLVPLLEAGESAATRRAAVEALVRRPKPEALRALTRLGKADPAFIALVLDVIRGARPPLEPLWSALLAPQLDGDADPARRRDAMRILGERGDPRFLAPFLALVRRESDPDVLAQWFRWAAAIDADKAAAVIFPLVETGAPAAARALLAAAGALHGRAALGWARGASREDRDANLRRAALRILMTSAEAADRALLRTAVDDEDPLVALEAVEALSAAPDPQARAGFERLIEKAHGLVAAAALRGLVAHDADRARALTRLIDTLRAAAPFELRVAALELLRAEEVVAARELVAAVAAEPVWQLRAAAYRALARGRDRACLEVLIARLPAERGAGFAFLREALHELTGFDHGDDAAVWTRWWELVGKEFRIPAATPRARAAARGAGATSTGYWGIPLRGDHFVFVVDLSGSMRAELEGKTRLDLAKERLIATLEQLGAGRRFAIVAFGTALELFDAELVPADAEHVAKARAWVERLAIRGATNLYDSLERALQFEGAETIFLLTDGGPTAGKLIDMDEIRRAIRLQNRERLVRINTIQIGGGTRERSFLAGLAEENHGETRRN
ncbi:MAG: VWA domain-containing protein [Planctomycetes bacterium]|nr:VWA domain-containing protein [Planctomycetota bacterium]